MISITWVYKLNDEPRMSDPAADTTKPIIKIYLEPKEDDNFAPSNENIKIVIDAGNRARPVVNAFTFVTCCRNTGIIKRNPASGIWDIMEFMLPNPNMRFFRRDMSDKGSNPLLILLLCHNKNIKNKNAREPINNGTYAQFEVL